MANRPTKVVINCATGEKSVVEFTDEEIALAGSNKQAYLEQVAAKEAAEAEAAATKQSAIDKLTALGLTEDEALALVGQ